MPSAALFLLILTVASACRSEPKTAGPKTQGLELEPLAMPARAWTSEFQREAVLMADEIVIEGPFDLVDHVALRQDPEAAVYSSQTISAGLFQELASKPGAEAPVRAQLDGWVLAAVRRITVLQRPGDVPVLVRARGNVYWAEASGGAEKRENELVFEGRHEPVTGQ